NVLVATIQPTVGVTQPGGPLLESGGFDVTIDQPQFAWGVASVILYGGARTPAVVDRGGCEYVGPPPADAYLPQCPGSGDSSDGESDDVTQVQDWSSPWAAGSTFADGFREGAGVYGLGAYAVGGVSVADSSWVGFVVQPAVEAPQALPAGPDKAIRYTLNGAWAGPVTVGRLQGEIDLSLLPGSNQRGARLFAF
ncbi:MAG TPA: hypothetical protein VFC09_14310, partial [Candidatus Dormibacteraeota bacterium]|nr:hypothetical protein [Candidatus Dormibacteraeota bacterium]